MELTKTILLSAATFLIGYLLAIVTKRK